MVEATSDSNSSSPSIRTTLAVWRATYSIIWKVTFSCKSRTRRGSCAEIGRRDAGCRHSMKEACLVSAGTFLFVAIVKQRTMKYSQGEGRENRDGISTNKWWKVEDVGVECTGNGRFL